MHFPLRTVSIAAIFRLAAALAAHDVPMPSSYSPGCCLWVGLQVADKFCQHKGYGSAGAMDALTVPMEWQVRRMQLGCVAYVQAI